MSKKWNGTWPTNCDVCGANLNKEKVFYDARTHSGMWGLLCRHCFIHLGVGLGTGMGQEYDSDNLKKLRG